MAKFSWSPLRAPAARCCWIGLVLIALVLRAIFIPAGAARSPASWVFFIFGAFLVYTAVRQALEERREADFQENRYSSACAGAPAQRRLRRHSSSSAGRTGKRVLTPLVIVHRRIGTANVLFALDSIPAIFGLTQ